MTTSEDTTICRECETCFTSSYRGRSCPLACLSDESRPDWTPRQPARPDRCPTCGADDPKERRHNHEGPHWDRHEWYSLDPGHENSIMCPDPFHTTPEPSSASTRELDKALEMLEETCRAAMPSGRLYIDDANALATITNILKAQNEVIKDARNAVMAYNSNSDSLPYMMEQLTKSVVEFNRKDNR